MSIARAIEDGSLDLKAVARDRDETAMAKLVEIKGIGPWTAECYLLMALRRPDVWPAGDIALQAAVQQIKGLRRRPTAEKLVRIAEGWRPHRATAARMLWHHYLSQP